MAGAAKSSRFRSAPEAWDSAVCHSLMQFFIKRETGTACAGGAEYFRCILRIRRIIHIDCDSTRVWGTRRVHL